MIEHVRRRGELNSLRIPVIVASGDEKIINLVRESGGEVFRTLADHENGTSRVFELSQKLEFTHYLVLQGDELLVLPKQLDALLNAIMEAPNIDFMNLTTKLLAESEVLDQSVVKCVVDLNGKILFIFRKTPLVGPVSDQLKSMRKICGIFIISKSALERISKSDSTILEKSESIEQLRFLELGGSILSLDTEINFPSINLPSDVEKVNSILETDLDQIKLLRQIITEK